jgi:spore coat protein U-like protein
MFESLHLSKLKYLTLCAVIAFSSINLAHAGASSATTQATATMGKTCSISAGNVSFGQVQVNATTFDKWSHIASVTNNIQVLCNKKVSYTISGNAMQVIGGAYGYFMTGAADPSQQLQFDVYTNSNLNDGWFANGASYGQYGVAGTVSGTGTGSTQTIPLYFALYSPNTFPGYWPKPDSYSYNYTLTLSY